MYSQPYSASIGSRPGGGVGTGRKWPPVSTPGGAANNKPPTVAPKPKTLVNGGRPATPAKPFQSRTQEEPKNIPAWKKELDARRANTSQNDSDPPWKSNHDGSTAIEKRASRTKPKPVEEEEEDLNIPAWKRELNKAKATAENKPMFGKQVGDETPRPKPTPSWTNPKMEENSNSSSHNGPQWPKPAATVSWSQRQQQRNDDEEKFTPPPLPNAPKPGSVSKLSFDKFDLPVENLSGSFGSGASMKSTREESDNQVTSPKRRVSSFLHTKPSTEPVARNFPTDNLPPPPPPISEKPSKFNGVPPRLQIPHDVYVQPPPLKTSKPPNVVLLSKGKNKFPLPSFGRPSLTSRDVPGPPPANGRQLPTPPPADTGDFSAPPQLLPLPPGARDLPLPSLPPNLPSRPAAFEPPGLSLRPPPSPTPSNQSLPPPPTPDDDIYDDPEMELPSRSPLARMESQEMIPTWDDEDDADEPDAIYDETADGAPPVLPAGFPTVASVPQIPEEDEDMYEDVEEYMRLKKLQVQQRQTPAASGSVGRTEGSRKDKKKKDSEKKEKDIRKKFKLPVDGEIVPEGRGIVKESCKGGRGKSLSVSQGEAIDVVRMSDNPKGKWLVRNTQGEYGYVDSEKVQIDVGRLRTYIGSSVRGAPGTGGGPPVPPPPIPTEDEEEAIYDETADEDIYEEV